MAVMNGRQRNAIMHKYRNTTHNSNYDGSCMLHHFPFTSFKISGPLICVGLSVHVSTYTVLVSPPSYLYCKMLFC